jgi:cob(I)alamin adenosyltransferase
MVTLNKIYTRTGDDGTTALGDGHRTSKFSLRVTTYGTVDELNSSVGLATLHASKFLEPKLTKIQNDLFDLGADFCKPSNNVDSPNTDLRIINSQVIRLEMEIDDMNSSLEPLKSFVLPGGTASATYLHLCRTICRRAERYAVHLASKEKISPEAVKYLNRLSDWFFVAARFENKSISGDALWIPGSNR